jgi:transposase
MTLYAGLDVGDKATHLCVVDGEGVIVWRGACATDPEALAFTPKKKHAPGLVRAVLETGALSAFLYHGLTLRGVPATCICARHAKGVLRVRGNKTDAHDAEGLAHLARTGWFKTVHIKENATHLDRTRLEVREQLIRAHGAMANQLRGTAPPKAMTALTHALMVHRDWPDTTPHRGVGRRRRGTQPVTPP